MKSDFDIGTLFYILLMIIFIVAGAFGKKKKPGHVPSHAEPSDTDSPDELLTKKLRELFNEREMIPESGTGGVSEVLDTEEPLDIAPADESYGGLEKTVIPESVISPYQGSIEYQGEILDSLFQEEGISGMIYHDEDLITDEIKLSEGKELVDVDYNKELDELINNFDLRKAVIFSEVLNRREY